MKTKKVGRFLAVAASIGVVAVYGCGGGGGGSTPAATTTTVSTPAQAQSAGAAATSSASLASGTGSTLSNIAAPLSSAGVHVPKYQPSMAETDPGVIAINGALEKSVANNAPLMRATKALRSKALATQSKAPVVIPSTVMNCADGGTLTFGGSYDALANPPSIDLTATFLDCKENDQRNNGYMHMTGTFSGTASSLSETFTMTLSDVAGGSGKFTSDFFANSYTVLTGKLEENMSVSGTTTATSATAASTTFTGTGTMKYTDFLNAAQTYTITLTNLKETLSVSTANLITTTTMNVSGAVKEDWTSSGTAYSISITFTDFILTDAAASAYEDRTANGTITIVTTPTTFCSGGGTFVIATTTPIRYDTTSHHTTQGRQTINTDQVVIVWNAIGSITVTVSGGTPETYTTENDLSEGCSFADMPTSTGGTTTTFTNNTTTTNTTGNNLTATLTWTNITLNATTTNSDMDMHLKYFATTTPTSATIPTASINWHNVGVAQPLGSSGYTGILDYDMCGVSGCAPSTFVQGPEHISLNGLPQGYYVLSVDSYSLAGEQGAKLTVNLQIGNNSYTFPTKNLAASDSESGDYTYSWYRVTDILVDGTGVHLKPANTSVTPAPPLSLRAPKVKL